MDAFGLTTTFSFLILLAVLWQVPWKGVALWRAARNSHMGWFVAILLLNTLAILEIIYIFALSKRKPSPPLLA